MSTKNEETKSFGEIFAELVTALEIPLTRLAERSQLDYDKLERWKNGVIKRPQLWGDIIRIAAAMRLTITETNRLLDSTNHPSFNECQNILADRSKLVPEREKVEIAINALLPPSTSQATPQPSNPLSSFQVGQVTSLLGVSGMGAIGANSFAYQPETPQRVLNTLPTMSVELIGRKTIIEAITAKVRDVTTGNVICLRGFGGIGKSSIAIEIGHQCKADFSGGRYFLSLRDKDIKKQLFDFLGEIGYPTISRLYDSDIESLCKIVRGFLAEAPERVLLILDNAELVMEEHPEIIEQLYLAPPHVTIVTTRTRLQKIDSANDFEVGALSEQDSLDLLSGKGLDVVSQPSDALAIVKLLAGVPLALELAAVSMPSKISCAQLFGELTRDGIVSVVNKLHIGNTDSPERSVATSFALSLKNLSKEQKRILNALSLCPPSGSTIKIVSHMYGYRSRFHETVLSSLMGARLTHYTNGTRNDTRQTLTNRITTYLWNVKESARQDIFHLANKSLLLIDGERITLHPLLQYFLMGLLTADKNNEGIMRSMIRRHVFFCACEVGDAFTSTAVLSTNTSPLQNLDTYRDNLEWAQKFSVVLNQVIASQVMTQYWVIRDSPEAVDWMKGSQQAAIFLAKTLPPIRTTFIKTAAYFAQQAGIFYARRGDKDHAFNSFSEAIQLTEDTQNVKHQSYLYLIISEVHMAFGEMDKALESLETASKLRKDDNDKDFGFAVAVMKARSFGIRDDFDRALEQYELALGFAGESGGYEGTVPEAILRTEYGNALSKSGQRDKAEENFLEALSIAKSTGWTKLEALVLTGLGEHNYNAGEIALAKENIQRAIDLFVEVGDVLQEGMARISLGYITDSIEEIEHGITVMDSSPIDKPPIANENTAFGNRQLGRLYQVATLNNLDKSGTHYDKAIELDPDNADAYNSRGNIRAKQGKSEEALTDYNRAIALNPNYAEAYYNRGLARYNQNQLEEAIADYKRAIALNPNFAEAYYNRGLARHNLNQFEEAIADYDKAIQLNPDDASTYNNRGIIYENQGKLENAVADYNKAIELNPDYAPPYVNRGDIRKGQGKLEEAINDYDKAIQLDPEYALAYVNRGNALRIQGNLEGAVADYDKAIALNHDYVRAYTNRGIARYYLGQSEEAIADYNKAVALDPHNALAYHNRGLARYNLGRLAEAISDYDKAIALDPDDAEAYANRGLARDNQNQFEEAVADYDKAIALNPNNAITYNNRGVTRYNQNQFEEAVADYDNAIALSPDYAEAYTNRGLARYSQGKLEESIADYHRYVQLRPNAKGTDQIIRWIIELETKISQARGTGTTI